MHSLTASLWDRQQKKHTWTPHQQLSSPFSDSCWIICNWAHMLARPQCFWICTVPGMFGAIEICLRTTKIMVIETKVIILRPCFSKGQTVLCSEVHRLIVKRHITFFVGPSLRRQRGNRILDSSPGKIKPCSTSQATREANVWPRCLTPLWLNILWEG